LRTLYERIESLCADRGITVNKMCKESGAPQGSLSNLKAGKTETLSSKTISRIAAYFGVTADYVLGWSIDAQMDDAIAEIAQLKSEIPELQGQELEDAQYALAVLEESYDDMALASRLNSCKKEKPSETGELAEYLEDLRTRPETRALLEASRGMTKEQIEKMADFAKTLRGTD